MVFVGCCAVDRRNRRALSGEKLVRIDLVTIGFASESVNQ